MLFTRARFPICLALVLLAGCWRQPSRWDQAQQQTQGKQATTQQSQGGEDFNAFFPTAEAPFALVFKQEKTGTAIASLKKEGEEVATLSITDTANNPSAREKFASGDDDIAGFPLAAVGTEGMAVLVADRYQVQVRSQSADFGADERRAWLGKFKLAELAKLKPATVDK
jgi:hypothetical protein